MTQHWARSTFRGWNNKQGADIYVLLANEQVKSQIQVLNITEKACQPQVITDWCFGWTEPAAINAKASNYLASWVRLNKQLSHMLHL